MAQPGDFLRKAREFAGLSQVELADRLGIDRNTVRDAEQSVRPVRQERVVAWAMATGVDLAWLQWNIDACGQADMEFSLDVARARRDSNPKPSVSESVRPRLRLIHGGRSSVKPRLTVYGPAALALIEEAASL